MRSLRELTAIQNPPNFKVSKHCCGNIVVEVNVSQFSRTGNICCGNKFCCSETKNVFAWSQKHFCFADTTFASETYVSPSHKGLATMKTMLISFQFRLVIKKRPANSVTKPAYAHRTLSPLFFFQPISIWAFLSDSFTFVVETGYYHTQSSYFLPFWRRRLLKRSNARGRGNVNILPQTSSEVSLTLQACVAHLFCHWGILIPRASVSFGHLVGETTF